MPVVKTSSPSPKPSAPKSVPSKRPPSASKSIPFPVAFFGRFDFSTSASAASGKRGAFATPWLRRPGANPEGPLPFIDISGIRYRPSIMIGDGFGWKLQQSFRISNVFPSIAWIDD